MLIPVFDTEEVRSQGGRDVFFIRERAVGGWYGRKNSPTRSEHGDQTAGGIYKKNR